MINRLFFYAVYSRSVGNQLNFVVKCSKYVKNRTDRVQAECCEEPGDNQIAFFLHPSLTAGAEGQIAGERAEGLNPAHAPGLESCTNRNSTDGTGGKMVLLKSSG